MKKVISLILVIAMIASLAVAVSAHTYGNRDFIGHGRAYEGMGDNWESDNFALWSTWAVFDPAVNGFVNGTMKDGQWVTFYDEFNGNYCAFGCAWGGQEWATAQVQACAEMVKVLDITEGTKQIWATHANAITSAEMAAACEDVEEVSHLTVFRQRTVEAEGEIELSVKNWQTGPKNRTVVLFKGVEDEEWTVVAVSELGEKVAEAVLPGSGAYVVAMSW